MAFPAGPTFTPTTTSSAVFAKTLAPVATLAPTQISTQSANFSSAPAPQRLVPQCTPHTQMFKAHFEQQNLEMIQSLSPKIRNKFRTCLPNFSQFYSNSYQHLWNRCSRDLLLQLKFQLPFLLHNFHNHLKHSHKLLSNPLSFFNHWLVLRVLHHQ